MVDLGYYYVLLNLVKEIKCDSNTLESIEKNLKNSKLDTGFAYSSYDNHFSIIVIHKASNLEEFINTLEHEKNHVEMHICEALDINPYSEQAAHLSGNLAQYIIEEALCSIVNI